MCSKLKLTDLWNTSLLFDLNYKFELIGASLLALAKSIYYYSTVYTSPYNFFFVGDSIGMAYFIKGG